jgi:hypothetical protein
MSPFVRHFHFVWVLSGPLTIALVFLAAAAEARVMTCVSSIIVSSVLFFLLTKLTVDLVFPSSRSLIGYDMPGPMFDSLDPLSSFKV